MAFAGTAREARQGFFVMAAAKHSSGGG